MSARFAMSPRTPATCPPMAATAASSASWRRPVMNTEAPSAEKALAVARPIPLVPPVTTTTLFLNLLLIVPTPLNRQPAAAAPSRCSRNDDACSRQVWHSAFHWRNVDADRPERPRLLRRGRRAWRLRGRRASAARTEVQAQPPHRGPRRALGLAPDRKVEPKIPGHRHRPGLL